MPSDLNNAERRLGDGFFTYETISFKGTLELRDPSGNVAVFHRRQRIRILDRSIGVFLDRVWGDGVILANYVVHDLRLIDGFPSRNKWILLLGFPRLQRKGDVLEIRTSRRIIGGGFGEPESFWDSAMSVPTDRLSISIVPPDGYAFDDPEIATPTVDNVQVDHRRDRLHLRVREPKLHVPHKLIWSLKRRTGP